MDETIDSPIYHANQYGDLLDTARERPSFLRGFIQISIFQYLKLSIGCKKISVLCLKYWWIKPSIYRYIGSLCPGTYWTFIYYTHVKTVRMYRDGVVLTSTEICLTWRGSEWASLGVLAPPPLHLFVELLGAEVVQGYMVKYVDTARPFSMPRQGRGGL